MKFSIELTFSGRAKSEPVVLERIQALQETVATLSQAVDTLTSLLGELAKRQQR